MKVSVIITAGGIGKRMGAIQPKQFLTLKDKPILIHTIERFKATLPNAEFFLTLPQDYIEAGNRLLVLFGINNVTVIAGGKERFDSIKNALYFCTGEVIAVHDGVRPFVSSECILNLIEVAYTTKTAVPFLVINDSMRQLSGDESYIVPRDNYVTVQTPQCFESDLLKQAYANPYSVNYTDDASVVEAFGYPITLVAGNVENIKITTPFDLKIAELFV